MSLLVTIPHSGEKIPPQTPWLNTLPEPIVMCDVDRFVDVLYEPALGALKIPFVKTEWHRYAADMNRVPSDVNASSVVGHKDTSRKFNRGFHWVNTTHKQQLMPAPMSQKAHDELVELIYKPFHGAIRDTYAAIRKEQLAKTQQWMEKKREKNCGSSSSASTTPFIPLPVFHLDAHSMPSVGTTEHLDPNERRADIVVSDCRGKSCDPKFRDLVIVAYVTAGFKVALNWPYFGGRVTQQYGTPAVGLVAVASGDEEKATPLSAPYLRHTYNQHAIQVEMNRDLYMDEVTKHIIPEKASKVQAKVQLALEYIQARLPALEAELMEAARLGGVQRKSQL